MTREAFVRMIVANPDEDAPRLVYADWLEEHGECAEAERIRDAVAGKYKPEGRWSDRAQFSDLVGKTIASINGKPGDDEINITLVTGEKYKMYYEPD